jgi:AcrR family transcriptional regulator
VARPSLAAERRPQLLEAAARAIARCGFDAVRLVDVADEAGVSVGTIQHYFGSRERLLVESFIETNRSAVARAEAMVAATEGAPWARIEALVDHFLHLARWSLWFEIWSAANRNPALREALGAAYEAWRAPLAAAMQSGVADGSFRPDVDTHELAAAVVAFVDGLGVQDQLGVEWLTRDRAVAIVRSLLTVELRPAARLRQAG